MRSKLLKVVGIKDDEIAYNPAVIVQKNKDRIVGGKKIIAVRVENLKSDWNNPDLYDPRIMFFFRERDRLLPIPDLPIFWGYEDPWCTWLTGKDGTPQLLFGGVKVDFENDRPLITTQFHLASSVQKLNPLKPILEVKGMKDIRVVQLKNGKLAVFTRPTTDKAAPGRIGFLMIDEIEELRDNRLIEKARLLPFDIDPKIKIGANEAHVNKKTIHVFCHLATADLGDFEKGDIYYACYEFHVDPAHPFDKKISLKKVADRLDFPRNNLISKGVRFDNVIFPGGTGGLSEPELYVGVEDALIGVLNLVSKE